MSNKLKKKSPNYEKVKDELREKIKKEGGLNVTPELVKSYTEGNGEVTCTYDEFFDILSELSDNGYSLFKIVQMCKGEETRGLMICDSETTVAFAKIPKS